MPKFASSRASNNAPHWDLTRFKDSPLMQQRRLGNRSGSPQNVDPAAQEQQQQHPQRLGLRSAASNRPSTDMSALNEMLARQDLGKQ